MLSAAAVSAWVCKGRYGRGRKNQAQQDDNARQSFYAPCGLHHTSVPWSQAEMRDSGPKPTRETKSITLNNG